MERSHFVDKISRSFDVFPAVALLGPRQCGKTTLARDYASRTTRFSPTVNYFDLEDPLDLSRLENPRLALERLTGLVIIDEIQRAPELFPLLRVLLDRPDNSAKFMILGSASRDLIRQTSETLAGRIAFIELTPFALNEIPSDDRDRLWLRGGFPRSFLSKSDEASSEWRREYIRTFLERDIPSLGIEIPTQQLRRFWLMLSHYHGQIFNASEIGRSFGIADSTARRYVDILAGTFVIRTLQPWYENISKRQVKRPKILFRDSGLYHELSGIRNLDDLHTHTKLGASWEGFALEETIRMTGAASEEVYFWSIHQQAELDLLIVNGSERLGFEMKYEDAPRLTRSMAAALETLNLSSLTVVYPGDKTYPLGPKIIVKPLDRQLIP